MLRGFATITYLADDVDAARWWYAELLEAAFQKLLSMGAKEYQPITSRGSETATSAEFVTASVVDPFGNVLGIMYNPHYLEMVGR